MRRHLGLCLLGLFFFSPNAILAGSISGFVYNDANRDGQQAPSEGGVRNVQLTLLGAEGSVRQTTTTEADGSFTFSDLPDGDYLVSLPDLAGARASLPVVFSVPAPIPNFPFGSRRYSSPARLVANIEAADQAGGSPDHVGLGDSIGFGFNVCGSILGEDGYFEPTTDRLRRAAPRGFGADKQSYPGDETADLLDPDVDLLLFSNDVFYAVDERADLVSISIGGNDFLGAESGGDAELAEALVIARRNIQEILSSLVGELPNSDIEINTVYDNLEGDDPLHNTWIPIWMQVLRELAWGQASRVTVAETYPEYSHDEGGQNLGEPGLICRAFGLDDIHPTNRGYDVHEEKLWQAFGGVTVSGNEDIEGVYLGLTRLSGVTRPAMTEVVAGTVTDPDNALVADGLGALVEPDGGELRVSDFLQVTPPEGQELVRAVVTVTYRTTGAPIDDYYRFEASVDGTFSEPGLGPDTWNTIVPIVGSSGDGGAERLAYPDQPTFRTASATLTLGAPTFNGDPTLTLEDLDTLSVRLTTTAVGDADAFAVEWDSTSVEVFARPTSEGSEAQALGLETRRPLSAVGQRAADLLQAADRADEVESQRAVLLAGLSDRAAAVRLAAARGLRDRSLGFRPMWERLLADSSARVREVAFLALADEPQVSAAELELATKEADPRARSAAAVSLLERGHAQGTWLALELAGGWPVERRAQRALHSGADQAVLAEALSNPNRAVRVAAANALIHYPEVATSAKPALEALLGQEDPAESWAAREALASLQSVVALAGLREFAPRLQIEILEVFKGSAAAGALVALAKDETAPASVRQRAARALASSSDGGVRGLLSQLLEVDDLRVHRLAVSGLARGDNLSEDNGSSER